MNVNMVNSDSSPFLSFLYQAPGEVTGYIFSSLDLKSLQACAMASKSLSSVTIQETNINKCQELSIFIGNVCSRLDEDTSAVQRKSLLEIQLALNANFPNLVSLKQYIISIKNQVVDILQTLDEEQLFAIEDIPLPVFYENIFEVSRISSRLIQAKSIPCELQRSAVFLEISYAFTEVGDIPRAIDVANSIPPVGAVYCDHALRYIVRFFIEAKNIPRAIEVANSIPPSAADGRSIALQDICNILIKEGDIPSTPT
ncbi:MAG TPA: hypothetical protein VHL30_04875 [Chlamydiales bacterium]|jgi:hypothetical protein|nr:hypothetical protein [Chlamydiales bacterium]